MGKCTNSYFLWSDVLLYMYSLYRLQDVPASLYGDMIAPADFQTAQWFIASRWLIVVAVIVHWDFGMRRQEKRHSYLSRCSSHNITAGLEILCRSCYETMRIWAVELFKTFHHILMDIQYSCVWIQDSEPQTLSTDIFCCKCLNPTVSRFKNDFQEQWFGVTNYI